MRVVAINVTHDSSVCSYNDGQIEFFCKEERLTRVKRDNLPINSLVKLKGFLNGRRIDKFLYHVPQNEGNGRDLFYLLVKKLFNVETENYSSLTHHNCHAAVSFYNSGFEEALVFVIDRNGSIFFENGVKAARESESVYKFNYSHGIQPIYKSFWSEDIYQNKRECLEQVILDFYGPIDVKVHGICGIVKVYEAATTLIGQGVLENGKTMGLSSYGEGVEFESLFESGSPIDCKFAYKGLTGLPGVGDVACFNGFSGLGVEEVTPENHLFFANKAKQVQLATQVEVNKLIQHYVEKTKINKVCISGGYGLNVVANSFYVENNPNVEFYVEPLSDDTGISIGAAMIAYHECTGDKNIKKVNHNFYHYYEHDGVEGGEKKKITDLVKLLLSQKSVAIFQGAPEAGPRALGHRSILFDARNKNAKDIVNKIKKREWYRPFAGVILQEFFEEYFHTLGLSSSPNMVFSFTAKNKAKSLFPGVIHVDGTCRIQTVGPENLFLYQLLREFHESTGCPVLLNTSFNLAGEPLVQTKMESLKVLENSELDFVYFVDEEILRS